MSLEPVEIWIIFREKPGCGLGGVIAVPLLFGFLGYAGLDLIGRDPDPLAVDLLLFGFIAPILLAIAFGASTAGKAIGCPVSLACFGLLGFYIVSLVQHAPTYASIRAEEQRRAAAKEHERQATMDRVRGYLESRGELQFTGLTDTDVTRGNEFIIPTKDQDRRPWWTVSTPVQKNDVIARSSLPVTVSVRRADGYEPYAESKALDADVAHDRNDLQISGMLPLDESGRYTVRVAIGKREWTGDLVMLNGEELADRLLAEGMRRGRGDAHGERLLARWKSETNLDNLALGRRFLALGRKAEAASYFYDARYSSGADLAEVERHEQLTHEIYRGAITSVSQKSFRMQVSMPDGTVSEPRGVICEDIDLPVGNERIVDTIMRVWTDLSVALLFEPGDVLEIEVEYVPHQPGARVFTPKVRAFRAIRLKPDPDRKERFVRALQRLDRKVPRHFADRGVPTLPLRPEAEEALFGGS